MKERHWCEEDCDCQPRSPAEKCIHGNKKGCLSCYKPEVSHAKEDKLRYGAKKFAEDLTQDMVDLANESSEPSFIDHKVDLFRKTFCHVPMLAGDAKRIESFLRTALEEAMQKDYKTGIKAGRLAMKEEIEKVINELRMDCPFCKEEGIERSCRAYRIDRVLEDVLEAIRDMK